MPQTAVNGKPVTMKLLFHAQVMAQLLRLQGLLSIKSSGEQDALAAVIFTLEPTGRAGIIGSFSRFCGSLGHSQ
jgi:hypothetical protein